MIPIVLACDEHYIAPTYVAILSLLLNKKEETQYSFTILCPGGLAESSKEIIQQLAEQYGVPLRIVSMGKLFSEARMKIEHITVPTLYRLYLPQVLEEEKCIYLDSDIIVNGDLTELYEISLENNYIGGVLSEGIHLDRIYARELCKRIGLQDVSTYVNAGVLLMNLDAIRNARLMDNWMKLVSMEFPAQDQDILNLTCYGKIKVIGLKYNAMTKTKSLVDYKKGYRNDVYDINEVNEAIKNPVIIHYADRIKPWDDREVFWAEYWWNIVGKITDSQAKRYIENFICQNNGYRKKTGERIIKKKLIRLSQVLGIYGYLKRIEDYIKNKEVRK